MKLSVAIMGHAQRRDMIESLQEALDVDDVGVSIDTDPPTAAPAQRWRTGRAAWQMHDPDADYHLVLQDDAIVCADLIAGLGKAADQLGPVGLMSAYTGRARRDQHQVRRAIAAAKRDQHAWLSTWSLNWGVAIIAPTATIPDMLDWCDGVRLGRALYDQRIGLYYRDVLGYRCWQPYPSLVDHAVGPSLIKHGRPGDRVADAFHPGSALDVDFSAHAGLDPYLPPRLRQHMAQRSRPRRAKGVGVR